MSKWESYPHMHMPECAESPPRRLVGQRTMLGLLRALVPARSMMVMAVLAVLAALGLHVVAVAAQAMDVPGAARLENIARVFQAMPLWVLLAGSMSQLASRIVVAWDDWRSWLRGKQA